MRSVNDDEQYGAALCRRSSLSTYNFTGFNNRPRASVIYSRRGNPRVMMFVQRARAWELEGGAGAVVTNTGMSAIHLVTTVFLSRAICWSRAWLLRRRLSSVATCDTRLCMRVRFVDQGDERALQAALERKTEAGDTGRKSK